MASLDDLLADHDSSGWLSDPSSDDDSEPEPATNPTVIRPARPPGSKLVLRQQLDVDSSDHDSSDQDYCEEVVEDSESSSSESSSSEVCIADPLTSGASLLLCMLCTRRSKLPRHRLSTLDILRERSSASALGR